MTVTKYRTQLVREYDAEYKTRRAATSPAVVAGLLNEMFNASDRCEEHVWQLCLDTKMKVVAVFENSAGGLTSSICDPATVARNALLSNAYGVILAHNHPSGDPSPSNDDIQITKRISAGLTLLGLQLVDHVIIGDGLTASLKELGYM